MRALVVFGQCFQAPQCRTTNFLMDKMSPAMAWISNTTGMAIIVEGARARFNLMSMHGEKRWLVWQAIGMKTTKWIGRWHGYLGCLQGRRHSLGTQGWRPHVNPDLTIWKQLRLYQPCKQHLVLTSTKLAGLPETFRILFNTSQAIHPQQRMAFEVMNRQAYDTQLTPS